MTAPPPPPSARAPQLLIGAGLVFASHLLQVALFILLQATGSRGALPSSFLVILGFGLIQWVYVLPMIIVAAVRRRGWAALGMGLAGLLTLGANALVVAVIFSGPGHLVP